MFAIAIICPFIVLFVMLYYRPLNVQWAVGYMAGALAVATGFSFLSYWIGTRQDQYAEVWNYRVTAVQHFGYWDEEVQCRHPVYRTEYYTDEETYTDSRGRTQTREVEKSRQVFDHWMHPYDVDEHPEYWSRVTEYGSSDEIDHETYLEWRRRWNNESAMQLNRTRVHSRNDGGEQSNSSSKVELLYPVEDIRQYENKIRVSNSVFNYAPVSKAMLAKYWRPADKNYTNATLSYDNVPFTDSEDFYLRQVNAFLGPRYKIHVMILLWDSIKHSSDIMEDVLAAWRGPNKNELVIAIGVMPNRSISWCQVYSWCDDTTIHAKVRQAILDGEKLNFKQVGTILLDNVPTYWQKKNFRDFNYIKNPLPKWTYVLDVFLTLASSTGIWFLLVAYRDDAFSGFSSSYGRY